jgi:hypothetical protein
LSSLTEMIRAASVRIKDSTASSETVGMVACVEHAIKAKGESMSPHRRVILRHVSHLRTAAVALPYAKIAVT